MRELSGRENVGSCAFQILPQIERDQGFIFDTMRASTVALLSACIAIFLALALFGVATAERKASRSGNDPERSVMAQAGGSSDDGWASTVAWATSCIIQRSQSSVGCYCLGTGVPMMKTCD